jgi:hypothetical protein
MILFKAKCQVIRPTFRIMKYQFDVDPEFGMFGEYVVVNLMRERGEMVDGQRYQISFCPLFKSGKDKLWVGS